MHDDLTVGLPAGDPEIDALGAILADCFVAKPDRARSWLDEVGPSGLRVVSRRGQVLGGLLLLPMGQSFGGRIVPMTGIAGVGVAPEHRRSGAAAALCAQVIEELHADHVPLSALYPANETLYRRVGYEQAGSRFRIEIPATALRVPCPEADVAVRPATPADEEGILALHRAVVLRHPGRLERGDYLWNRVRASKEATVRCYVVEEDGAITGSFFFLQVRRSSKDTQLVVTDAAALTPVAARRLLRLLADHASIAEEVRWWGGPSDPFLAVLPEQSYRMTLDGHWMLRLVDVAAALEARGYPAGLTAELDLRVHDDLLPRNDAALTLRVADGRGTVTPGGAGSLDVDVRLLAGIYSGHLSPEALRIAEGLRCTDPERALLASVFAGPAPWMLDGF